MKRWLFGTILLCLVVSGCASTDRMMRMSGGVFDEYSAPKSSRLRSDKYQKISRELSSSKRSNRVAVSGMDDTLINIWPFFFRSNEYWSALWPLIDKDPYGFAFRPFYNHEGDDYSVLFPLSAWNPASGRGWVTLFAWTPDSFGLIPLTWQWKEGKTGGAYYTPLFFYTYDDNPLTYRNNSSCSWSRDEFDLFCFLLYYGREKVISSGNWSWLYRDYWDEDSLNSLKNEWNYRFQGKKPFPEDEKALDKFRKEIFETLPRITEKGFGIFPLWLGWMKDNGDYMHRFMLISGIEKSRNFFEFDILGHLIADYETLEYDDTNRYDKSRSSFNSWVLLSGFSTETKYRQDDANWKKFDELHSLISWGKTFAQQKPAIEDALAQLDPSLKLPETVVDMNTYELFLEDLWKKYEFPTYNHYSGTILPLVWYDINDGNKSAEYTLPFLLTSWGYNREKSYFKSYPLMTFINKSATEESTTILTPLVYYSKTFHRERSNYPVFDRETKNVSEHQCVELRDRYAVCGLFYRGRFGFNVVKEGFDADDVESLRRMLISLPQTSQSLRHRHAQIVNDTSVNDRWQTTTEIERLQKLIRYEEIKIAKAELAEARMQFQNNIAKALTIAGRLGIKTDVTVFGDSARADSLRAELVEKCTELRFYEDIGNGIFFHKAKYYNGDNNWHFMHILAGGEKVGERESSHILHLLYRYRKEGNRTEKIYFPFISSVTEGDDSRFSFMWRLFSIGQRGGKTGGYIFFIPFGYEWD